MQPLVSLRALERALSPERVRAYRLPSDQDETDGLARYLWNLSLSSAIQPALHALEVSFRNEVSGAARKITAKRGYRYHRVPSWLDATPTMLLEHEAKKVGKAKERLGVDAKSQTEGHLIAKLDFGFWVALCQNSYADWRAAGPRLWPRALDLAFQSRPPEVTTRSQIFHQFDSIRQYRNRAAHHEPLWDRDYLASHEAILESLAWMSPKVADTVRAMSPAPTTFAEGYEAYRPQAETILGTGHGVVGTLDAKLKGLAPGQRTIVECLVQSLSGHPDCETERLFTEWLDSQRSR